MALIFDIGFRMNGDSLDKAIGPQIQTIAKEISNAFSTPAGKGMTTELTKAVHAAQTLEGALKRATTDRGISFITLQSELRKSGTTAEQIVATLASAGPQFAGSFNIALQTLSQANRQVIQISNRIKEMQRVMVQSIKFTAAQEIQRAFMSAIQASIGWVKDLNEEITNIAIVSGKTGKSLEKVYQTIIDGSRQLRVEAREYAEGALIYYQQGLSDEEVQRRTEVTIQAAKAAGQSVETMSKQLTAIWNTYKMVGDEQQRAASAGAALAANTAVEFKDIAEAMQIAAAPAEQMGVSYDSLAAIIATVGDATQQSASVIGNAYKTIFSRFQQLTTTGTDGEVTLNRVSSKLQSLGVEVLNASGKLRELDHVILEVGNAWNDYSQEQQLAIAQLVGGTRQYGQFLSLMNNFDKYKMNLNLALGEDGATLESQFSAAQKTIESAAINAKEVWTNAFSEIFQEEAFIKLYNMLEDAGVAVDHMIDGLGGLPGILLLAATILSRRIIPTLNQGRAMIVDSFSNITQSGRERSAQREADTMRAQTQQNFAIQRSGTSERQRIQLGFQENAANLKIDQYQKVTTVMGEVNKMLNSNSEQMKIQGKYLKEQIDKYQSMYNVNVDLLANTQARAQQEKETAETIMKSNMGITPRGEQAQNIAANNAQIERLKYSNQTQYDKIAKIGSFQTELNHNGPAAQGLSQEQIGALQNKLQEQLKIKQEIIAANNQMITQLEQQNAAEMGITKGIQERRAAQAGVQKIVAELKLKVAELAKEQDAVFDPKEAKNYFNQLKKYFQTLNIDIQEVGDELELAFNQLSTGGQGEQSEMSQGLENIKKILDEMSEDEEIDLQVNTDGLDEVGEQVEGARTGLRGLETVIDSTNNKMVGLQLSFTDIASSALSLGTNAIYLTSSFQNMANALKEGDMVGFAAGLTALSFQIPSIIKSVQTLSSAMAALNAVRVLGNQIATAQSHQITLETAAKAANVVITEGMTVAETKAAFAAKGLNIQLAQEKDVVAANSVVTGVNAAAWWAHPVVLILLGAIMLVVGAFVLWNAHLKKNAERAREAADETQKLVDENKELTKAIGENTIAVKDNVQAWKDAILAGESAEKEYDAMIGSLTALNEKLVEAGANSNQLNEAMRGAVNTGDFSDYYEMVEEIQRQQAEELVASIGTNNKKQLEALNAEMAANGGTSRYIESQVMDDTGIYVNDKGFEAVKEQLEDFGFVDGQYSLDLTFNFENPEEFQRQYKSLIEMEKEYRKVYGDAAKDNANYRQIVEMIEQGSAAYEGLVDSAKEAQSAIKTALNDQIATVSDIAEDGNFTQTRDAMYNLQQEVIQLGKDANLTEEQINSLMNSIVNSSPAMIKWAETAQKGQEIRDKLIERQSLAYDNTNQYDNAKEMLAQQSQETSGAFFGIGKWNNGLSATQEKQLDLIDSTGALRKEIEKLSKAERSAAADKVIQDYYANANAEIDDQRKRLVQLDKEWTEFMNGLTAEQIELLPYINTENIEGLDDVKDKLAALEELDLKVKVDYQSIIDASNSLQKNLGDAISEYQKGTLSYDTVEKLLALGPEYKRFIMETKEGYVLTTEAIDAYNKSIENEREAINGLLNQKTDFSLPFSDLAYAAADLSAMPDSIAVPGIETAATNIAKLTEAFWNGDIAKDQYFEGTDGLLQQIDNLSSLSQNLSIEQLEEMAPTMAALSSSLLGYIDKAKEAYAAGEIDGGDFANELNRVKEAAQDINNIKLNKLDKQLTGLKKTEDGLIDMTQDLTEEQKLLAKAFNLAKEKAQTFEKASKKMDIGEEILGTTSEYYNKLKDIFNEDDLTLKVPAPEIDFSWLDEMNSKITSSLSTLDAEFKSQLSGLVKTAAANVSEAYGLETQMADITRNIAQYMIDNNVDFATALEKNTQNMALSEEQIATIHAAASATIVETGNLAVNEGMAETIDTLEEGEAEAAKFSVKISVKEAGIDGTFPVKFNILGKDFSFDIPKPYLTLEATDTGDMSFTKLLSGGNGNDTPPTNPLSGLWDDYTGLQGSHPTLDSLEVGDPGSISTDDQGTTRDDKGGDSKGGGDEKIPEHEDKNAEEFEKMEDRYSTLKAAIDDVERALEDFSNAEDDAFGAAKFAAMKKQEQSLTKQAKLYQDLRQKALEYLKMDQEEAKSGKNRTKLQTELISRGLEGDLIEATFDDDGFVANRTEIINELNTMLQSAYQEYKTAADYFDLTKSTNEAESERIDGLKDNYEKLKALVEAYLGDLDLVDETAGEARQALLDELEKLREWMQKKVDQANYKLELRMGINEMDIKMMEMTIRLWDKLGVKMGSTFKNLNSNLISSADNLSGMVDNSKRMWEILDNISPDSEHQEWFVGQFGEDAWKEYLDGNGALPDSVVQNLEDKADMMMDELSNMYDIAEEMLGQFVEAMNMFIEDFDKIADKLSRQNEKLDMFEELLDFSGKKYSDEGREAMMGILQARMDNAKVAVANAKAEQEFTKVAVDEAKASLEQFYAQEGRDVSAYDDTAAFFYNQLKNSLDEAEAAATEAESKFYSSMQELTAAARAAIEESARIIEEELVDSLGGIFDSFNSGLDMYQHQEDIGNFFLDDYDKGYELKKLLGEIEDAMEDVSDPERLSEWGTLIDDINAANEDGVKITQTDLDILKARFDLQKAYDEYSDARAGKNTMRLQRDASGNYSYVYSNDGSSASDDSQQKVEDALHNIHKMHQEAADEMSSMWFQTYVEMQQYMSNVDQLRLENDAEYAAEVQWYKDMYQQKLEHYRDQTIQHNTAIDRSYDETTLGIITGMKDMESTHDWYMQQAVLYDEKLKESALSWEEQVRNTCNENGVNYDNLEHTVQEDTGLMIEENEALRKKIEELKTDGTRSLQLLGGEIRSFTLNGINQLGEMKRAVEELIGKLQELKNAQLGKIEDMEAAEGYYDRNTDYTSLFGNLYSDYKANAGESAMSPEEYLNKNPWIVDQVYAAMMNDDRRGDSYKGDNPNFSRDDAYQHLINGWQGFRPGDWNFGTEGSNIEIDTDKVVVNGDKHNIMPTASGGLIKTPQVRSLAEEGPELVLNAEDTENILRAVKYMRETVQAQMGAAWDKQYAAIQEKVSHASSTRYNHDEEYKAYLDAALAGQEQKVQIEAHFPGVTAASEIEEAFNQLITQAAQYRIRQDR